MGVVWVGSNCPISRVYLSVCHYPRCKGRTSVPYNGLESKDTLCDSPDSVIDVSERRSPVSGNSSSVEVGDELHCPSELTENILVRH